MGFNTISADLVGAFTIVVGTFVFVWTNTPTKLDHWSAIAISLVLGLIGGTIWAVVLSQLKLLGLEPESTNPFGGTLDEARLIGGACLGTVYFFPIATWLAKVDIKKHDDLLITAVKSNVAFLFGTTAGSALFYGSHIRAYITHMHWSYLHQEVFLVMVWSGLIAGFGNALYATVNAISTKSQLWPQIGRSVLGTVFVVFLCMVFVYGFIEFATTPANRHVDARGIFVGAILFPSLVVAHEMIRGSIPAIWQNMHSSLKRWN